jgi:uncharacterized protein (TIGR02001 family)
MRKTTLSLLIAAALVSPLTAFAQAAAAPQSPHTLTGNMAIVSDYRFRGISQTFGQPAIQGGIDYSHASGFYLGNWNSNVSGNSYNGGAGIEMDFYGGFKKAFGDFGFDVGLLQYYYPSAMVAGTNTKYDTLEGYLAVSWKWLSAKYSVTTTDYFGLNNTTFATNSAGAIACTGSDSKGSGYLDISASYEIRPKLTVVGHYGNQSIKDCSPLEYSDYKIGLTYDASGWLLGAAYIDTDADPAFYTLSNGNGASTKTKDVGKGTVVLSVSKSF